MDFVEELLVLINDVEDLNNREKFFRDLGVEPEEFANFVYAMGLESIEEFPDPGPDELRPDVDGQALALAANWAAGFLVGYKYAERRISIGHLNNAFNELNGDSNGDS